MSNRPTIDADGRDPPGSAADRRSWPNRPTARWIAWYAACGLPPAHIAIVVRASETAVRDYLDGPISDRRVTAAELARMRAMRAAGATLSAIAATCGRHRQTVFKALRRSTRRREPTGPPRRARGAGRSVLGPAAAKIRRLTELGYPIERIAVILDLALADVESIVDRTKPIRRAALVRPRSRAEHAAIRPPRRPRRAPKTGTDAQAWRYLDDVGEDLRYLDDVIEPAASPAAELVAGQADAVVSPPAAPKATSSEWTGPVALGGRRATLSEADVRAILLAHAAGRSIYGLAQEYHVNPGTVRAIVRGVTWTHVERPLPCPAPTTPLGPIESDDRCDQ